LQVPNMFRVTSLTSMDDRQLNRWIKRLALLLVAGVVVFTAFYVLDRWRAPATPMVDRQLSALEQAVRDDPENMVARGQLADTYVAKGRFDEAIAQYDQLTSSGNPLIVRAARLGKSSVQLLAGQFDPAIATLKEMAEQKDSALPTEALLMELARAYRLAGKTEDAKKTLTQVVEQHADSPFASEAKAEIAKLAS